MGWISRMWSTWPAAGANRLFYRTTRCIYRSELPAFASLSESCQFLGPGSRSEGPAHTGTGTCYQGRVSFVLSVVCCLSRLSRITSTLRILTACLDDQASSYDMEHPRPWLDQATKHTARLFHFRPDYVVVNFSTRKTNSVYSMLLTSTTHNGSHTHLAQVSPMAPMSNLAEVSHSPISKSRLGCASWKCVEVFCPLLPTPSTRSRTNDGPEAAHAVVIARPAPASGPLRFTVQVTTNFHCRCILVPFFFFFFPMVFRLKVV